MTPAVTSLWRFPIKSHGREEVKATALAAGEAMPFDRIWAVAHDRSDADGRSWVSCRNFSIGSKAERLGAITSHLDEASQTVTLHHPDLPDLTFRPDTEGQALIAWAGPLIPANRAQSARVVRGQTQAFTDTEIASVTLCNLASHRAVEAAVGHPLSPHRWRSNIWFDGPDAWAEFDWLGRDVQIGGAVLRPVERTERCLATHNNPDTGRRDADVLAALDTFGHRDFSVRAVVIRGGIVRAGDTVQVL